MALVEESLEAAQRLGTPSDEAVPRQLLALIALRRGDLARAGALMAQALRLAWDYGFSGRLPDLLDEMALTAEGQGRVKQAARLLGAAARTFQITGVQPDRMRYPDIEAMKTRGQAALGEEAWHKAYAAGLALPLEEAIAEAFDQTEAVVTSHLTSMDESRRSP